MSNRRKIPVAVQDQMDAAANDAYRKVLACTPRAGCGKVWPTRCRLRISG